MDSCQGQHMELCSVLCGGLDGRKVWGRMDPCVCMAESLWCWPKTVTISLISYTPYKIKSWKKLSLPWQNALPPLPFPALLTPLRSASRSMWKPSPLCTLSCDQPAVPCGSPLRCALLAAGAASVIARIAQECQGLYCNHFFFCCLSC